MRQLHSTVPVVASSSKWTHTHTHTQNLCPYFKIISFLKFCHINFVTVWLYFLSFSWKLYNIKIYYNRKLYITLPKHIGNNKKKFYIKDDEKLILVPPQFRNYRRDTIKLNYLVIRKQEHKLTLKREPITRNKMTDLSPQCV